MQRIIASMYKEDVSLSDARLLTLVACMFFCIKRFDDVILWKWENIRETSNGGYIIIQPSSKTDQLAKGVEIKIPSSKAGRIGPAEVLRWYFKKCCGL